MNPTYYAGIGSRETPCEILLLMSAIGMDMHRRGYTLRSGGAVGADTAFAQSTHRKEIYRPRSEGGPRPEYGTIQGYPLELWGRAQQVAAHFHPDWEACSWHVQDLHTRNVFQILGRDLETPSEQVICWTPDGADGVHIKTSRKTGGTGQAIRIAAANAIPVYNLCMESTRKFHVKRLQLEVAMA